ncbi:hypothetical protein DSO57_1031325 [Entomophthora muscae]|uniref:Uncharacterized protein n=2 Tax=Entomophthora muscae TaxID=34485 RepID=A0ACC2TZ89_9FUNG|nr:hypothetical protein DSO57_1031324 [Entomophthora muscae]KAJ9079850.1 hypothetical protein DSO57_1031325 [Entomophthora muscae]
MKLYLLAFIVSLVYQVAAASYASNPDCKPLIKDMLYDCGTKDDLLKISNVTITPPVLKRGSKVEVHIQGHLSGEVTHGSKIFAKVYKGYFRLYNDEKDLCDLVDKANGTMKCPFQATTINLKQTVDVPELPVSGTFAVEVYATSQNKKPIFNFKANVRAE